MIILIGGNKGSAKSTLTLNIATFLATLATVEVIDGDPQKSVTKWFNQRKDNYPENITFDVIHKTGSIDKYILERQEEKDIIIIDVAGYNSTELSSAMLVADLLITPFETSQFSLDTLDETIIQEEFIKKENKDLIIRSLQTRATTIHNIIKNDRDMFIAYCSEYGIEPFNTTIFERRVWKMVSFGRSIYDFNSKAALKAQEELHSLAKEILILFGVEI